MTTRTASLDSMPVTEKVNFLAIYLVTDGCSVGKILMSDTLHFPKTLPRPRTNSHNERVSSATGLLRYTGLQDGR